MATEFTEYGSRFLGDSGILRLMDDLGQAARQPGVIMLGGGNPAHIPEVQTLFRTRMERILDSEDAFERMIGNYSAPGGDIEFVDSLASFLRRRCGWPIEAENIVLTNGSQTAFFFLFNLYGGPGVDGRHRRILLPLAPEYIGYEDAGIAPDIFVARRPQIEHLPDRLFKYHVDFEGLEIGDDIGALCVSRPTNPTGNVLTQAELSSLSELARRHDIPLIVDNAYGAPFPGIIFNAGEVTWEPHVIMCLSLSKLGLPGARTGIVVAHPEVVRAIAAMNAVVSLAPGSFGASLALDLVRSGEILALSQNVVRPHYAKKAAATVALLQRALAGTDFHIHRPEGAFFLWIWMRDLPITCAELYQRLKARGVLVVPGHFFFPGLPGAWRHKHECIRLSYAADPDLVEQGVAIIGEEVQRAYGEAR